MEQKLSKRPPPQDGMADLFPPLTANRSGFLEVGDGHRLYWEECGNPNGVPALFVHGGPGAGLSAVYRRFFDPDFYRIVLFDQRGAGRSTPQAAITDNTTQHLIADMERLRVHLKIERWLLFGGSWGSTLALAYGETHPARCLGFVLRGVFLFRRREVDWFLNGIGRIFPEARRAFLDHLPPEDRADPLQAYHRLLHADDPDIAAAAARAWCGYEEACSRLLPRTHEIGLRNDPSSLATARLEVHYMRHGGFVDEGQLLAEADRLTDKPCAIVQGRYDMVCPAESAHALASVWPGARLTIVPDAGHSALEPGVRAALVAATQDFRGRLDPAFTPRGV